MRRTRCRECGAKFKQPMSGRALLCSDECRDERRRRLRREADRRWLRRRAFADGIWIARIHREAVPAGRRLTFTPDEIAFIQERYASGVPARQLAERFSVSKRSILRVLELGVPVQVKVGRYVAWFAPKRSGCPVMLTEWIGVTSNEVAA